MPCLSFSQAVGRLQSLQTFPGDSRRPGFVPRRKNSDESPRMVGLFSAHTSPLSSSPLPGQSGTWPGEGTSPFPIFGPRPSRAFAPSSARPALPLGAPFPTARLSRRKPSGKSAMTSQRFAGSSRRPDWRLGGKFPLANLSRQKGSPATPTNLSSGSSPACVCIAPRTSRRPGGRWGRKVSAAFRTSAGTHFDLSGLPPRWS